MSFPWTCPYCQHKATIVDSNFHRIQGYFNHGNIDKEQYLTFEITVCPNDKCKEYEIIAWQAPRIWKTVDYGAGEMKEMWSLKPQYTSKQLPSYVPRPIANDYYEACKILRLSPKASATLARRCLQGMIRDYWGISKSRLIDEIDALEDKVDPTTWESIDGLRRISNIGAHMEKDVNIIIDIEPDEADLLIKLIEDLIDDWYVAREDRRARAAAIKKLVESKKPSAK